MNEPDTLATENLVRLVVNGEEFGGWKSVRITPGIERQARDFDLSVTDVWPGRSEVPRRIRPFDACQVFIGSDLVLTGYVDATPIKYDGKNVTVSVRGRSKTADLVDCCPVDSGEGVGSDAGTWAEVKGKDAGLIGRIIKAPARTATQWRHAKLEVIAAALAAPYGIRVVAEVDTGAPIPDHQVQVGESVFESIDRMMRLRHVLSTDNEQGDLVIVDPGSRGRAATALELGVNIRSSDAGLDYKGVFSEYRVKGQRAGNDQEFGEDVSESEGVSDLTGESFSAGYTRSRRRRVLVIQQSGQADDGTCRDRAEYERAHRAAKALETTYVVTGWRQEDGSLWLPNQTVRVRDGLIGFNDDMLIAEVSYILDDQGMRCEIRVGPPDGYRTKAGKLKKSQKGGGTDWSDVK